jgi:thymidylate kinase
MEMDVVLIAIVGCDGAGKSTSVSILSKKLATGFQVKTIDKWQILDGNTYPEFGFLRGGLSEFRRYVREMPEGTRTLFLFWMLHGMLTSSATANADVVTLDGYWAKHAAAEIVYSGRRDLIEMLAGLLRKPDLTLFLDVDPVVAYGRRVADLQVPLVPYECGLDQSCSEVSFIHHQTKIRNIMVDWRSRFSWTSIDANLGQGDVVDAVFSAVGTRFPRLRAALS